MKPCLGLVGAMLVWLMGLLAGIGLGIEIRSWGDRLQKKLRG